MLPLIVVDGDGPPLLADIGWKSSSWIWHNIFPVNKTETLSDVLDQHKIVFSKGLVTIKGFKGDIKLQNGAKPVCCKARPMTYALRQKVKEELFA